MYKIEHFSFTLTPIIPSKYVDVSVSSYLFVSEDIIFPLFVENHFRKNLIKANFSIDVNNSRKYINNYVAVSTYKHFKDLVPESLIKTNTGILVVRFCVIYQFIDSASLIYQQTIYINNVMAARLLR